MKFLICLLFLISFSAFAANCDSVQTRIIFYKKAVLAGETLCLMKTADSMIFYLSKSCADKKCEILLRKKTNLIIKDYYSNFGSPGFKLCFELGGVPKIFEFSKDKVLWQSAERCFFEKDFVEISLLTRLWKNHIKN